ncbi:MAG TPA: hypothetical protein PKG81_02405 [Candidatus Omnitrophota bacterium]|nr:hypothetical protein [Candidatus Omnitrophota bacterium]
MSNEILRLRRELIECNNKERGKMSGCVRKTENYNTRKMLSDAFGGIIARVYVICNWKRCKWAYALEGEDIMYGLE